MWLGPVTLALGYGWARYSVVCEVSASVLYTHIRRRVQCA